MNAPQATPKHPAPVNAPPTRAPRRRAAAEPETVALTAIRPGEVVLHIGAGTGADTFAIARRLGMPGRVTAIEANPASIAQARRDAADFRRVTGLDNVEFHFAHADRLPVADESMDLVVSSFALVGGNGAADCWRELARVVRPGGRLALLEAEPPAPADVERSAREAGFVDVRFEMRTRIAADSGAALPALLITASRPR